MSIKPLIFNRRTAEEARDLLASLQSPNKLPISAIEGGVTSVNGQTGNVTIGMPEIPESIQPLSDVLTELSQLDTAPSGMLWQENSKFSIAPISGFVRDLFSSPNDSFYRGMLGLGDGAVLDINVANGIPTLNSEGLLDASVIDLPASSITGSYNDLSDKPFLFDGDYGSLTNRPNIPDAQIQSDWNQSNSSALDFIKNKPAIPTVSYPVTSVNTKTGAVVLTNTDVGAAATVHTHAIADVTGLQTSLNGKISTGASIPYSTLTGAPTLATVATSGSYLDLTNRPTIPAAQVQSDWNATAGLGVILNKPTIPTTTTQIAEGTNLYHTDARVQTYLTANGYRKVETLQGTTNASGVYQVTFANTYSVAPHVNPVIIGGTANQVLTVSNVTTTGCTITVVQRSAVTLLAVEVLLAATTAVSGATVGVLVIPKS